MTTGKQIRTSMVRFIVKFIMGVIQFNERNDRERISKGGQVLRDDRESSGNGS